MLQAVCSEDPAVYDTLAGLRGDQAGIRSVAAYVEVIAEAVPQVQTLLHDVTLGGEETLRCFCMHPFVEAMVNDENDDDDDTNDNDNIDKGG